MVDSIIVMVFWPINPNLGGLNPSKRQAGSPCSALTWASAVARMIWSKQQVGVVYA